MWLRSYLASSSLSTPASTPCSNGRSFGSRCRMNTCCSSKPMPFSPNHCIHFSSIFLTWEHHFFQDSTVNTSPCATSRPHQSLLQNRFANPWIARPRCLPTSPRQRRTLNPFKNSDGNDLRALGRIQPRPRSRRRLLQPSHQQSQHTSSAGYRSSICHRNNVQPQCNWQPCLLEIS